MWSPPVTSFTFHCPFPPSAVTLWAAHGGFEDSPHYISTEIVRAEGMRISQGYFGPKKKKRKLLSEFSERLLVLQHLMLLSLGKPVV